MCAADAARLHRHNWQTSEKRFVFSQWYGIFLFYFQWKMEAVEKMSQSSAVEAIGHFYSPREELVNAVTHGAGAVAVVAGMVLLGVSVSGSGWLTLAAVAVYSVSLLAMYLASTLYHAVSDLEWKAFFRRMDHCAIYLLIAGTYTPLMLLAVGGAWGLGILIAVWALAGIGIAMKCLTMKKCGGLSLCLYLTMGWLCMLCVRPLFLGMSTPGLVFLIAGGVFYTAGVLFYVNKRPYFHAVWHFFVLTGSTLHFLTVWTLL